MGVVDDYINGLEGKDDLTVEGVVKDILKLHNDEIGTRESKIAEITAELGTSTSTVAERDAEITKWKAKNFDLAMQIPGNQSELPEENQEITGSTITPDDLFEIKE